MKPLPPLVASDLRFAALGVAGLVLLALGRALSKGKAS